MIVCKYIRVGPCAYYPHVDALRFIGMAVRRSKADIAFSEGFNPHMLLHLSSPMPLGVESECEYFTAVSRESAEEFARKLNSTLHPGMRVVRAQTVEKANVAALCAAASYEITAPGFDPAVLADVMARETLTISYSDKGARVEKEVRGKIYALSCREGKIYATLGYGNNNLRADRLIQALSGSQKPIRMDILKKKMYTIVDGVLIDADQILFGKAFGG